MNCIFLILVFFTSATLRLEKACKTVSKIKPDCFVTADGEKKPFYEFYDLIIVGAGAQGVATVFQLSISKIKPPYRILIVEMKAVLGVGLPYDPKVVKPEHLMNVFSASKVAISGQEAEFLEWIDKNSVYGNAWFDFIYRSVMPKRQMIGKYLRDRFEKYVEKCRNKDYTIDTMNSTEAVNIQAHDGNGYLIKLSKKTEIFKKGKAVSKMEYVVYHVRDVLLATGHWYRSRFKNPPNGYYESPWPADRLRNEIKPVHIGILGGGLSGIDAVFTLAHRFGEFDYFLDFKREDFKNFNITVYSRSGYLPGVRGASSERFPDYEPISLTFENIDSEIRAGLMAFDAIFKLLKQDLTEILKKSIANLDNTDTMEPAEFFGHVDTIMYPDRDPERAFLLDIEGDGSPHRKRLQKIFMMAERYFQLVRKDCKAEDFIKFKEFIAPRVVKATIEIPMENAKKLRALMEKGYLHLRAIGHNYKIDEKIGGQGVTIRYRHEGSDVKFDHDYFVDAFGQSGHIASDPSLLTQSLLKNNLSTPIRFLYEDQDYAEKVYNDNESKDKNRYRIVEIDGQYYLDGDGVVMDKDKSLIMPADRVSNIGHIFGSGPFILGDTVPVAYGLQTAVEIATNAVKHVERVRDVSVGG